MASFNRVVLVGNLTRDPELRYIPSGTAVSDIGLAVNDRVIIGGLLYAGRGAKVTTQDGAITRAGGYDGRK